MGIGGGSVLVPWRPFFWIAAEVVIVRGPPPLPRLSLPHYVERAVVDGAAGSGGNPLNK